MRGLPKSFVKEMRGGESLKTTTVISLALRLKYGQERHKVRELLIYAFYSPTTLYCPNENRLAAGQPMSGLITL